jgi:hypothetical protein
VTATAVGGHDGTHTVSFYSVDAACNTETVKSVPVRIDTQAPTVEFGPIAHGGGASLAVKSTDRASGVAWVRWRVAGGAWTTGTVVPLTSSGATAIEAQSADNAGNLSAVATRSITSVGTRITSVAPFGLSPQTIQALVTYDGEPVTNGEVRASTSADGRHWSAASGYLTGPLGIAYVPMFLSSSAWVRLSYDPSASWWTLSLGEPVELIFRAMPPAVLTTPKIPAVGRSGSALKVSGTLRPAHTKNSRAVKLVFERQVRGAWIVAKTVSPKVTTAGHLSRYSFAVKLHGVGRWRVHATHADASHTPSSSGLRQFRLK